MITIDMALARNRRLEAENRRLRRAMEGLAAQFDVLAARALERKYYPSTALRYNDWLRQFAYDTREALRQALAPEGDLIDEDSGTPMPLNMDEEA